MDGSTSEIKRRGSALLTRPSAFARAGFAIAPILYMLGLVGVGAGVLFSGYSQILRSNVQVTNDLTTKNDLQAAATNLSATSVLGATDNTILCPPQGGTASANCTAAPTKMEPFATILMSPDASHLPADYTNAGVTGSVPGFEVGVFAAGTGMKQFDAYGHFYVYCRWEQSTTNGTDPAIAVLSAGPDGKLDTVCSDSAARGDDMMVSLPAPTAVNRSAVWQTNNGSNGTQAEFGQVGSKLVVDALGNMTVPGSLTVAGASSFASIASGNIVGTNGTFSGTLGVTGNASMGALTATSGSFSTNLAVTGNQTVGGSLGVTGATTITGALTAGDATLNSAIVANNISAGGDLGVTGAAVVGSSLTVAGDTTLGGALSAGAATLASAAITGNTTVGGTLGVTGNATVTGSLTADAGAFSSASVAGALTAASVTASGDVGAVNGTFSGTVTAAAFNGPVTGNVTGTATNVSGVVAIANGGTGASNAATALSNLGGNNATNLTTGTLDPMRLAMNSIPGADIVSGSITATQLDNTGVTAGAYNWGTVDANGRVTFAQNIAGTAGITDGAGNSITASSSSGNGVLTFTTNNAVAAVIDHNGYLGLGTSSPAQRLDVNGNVLIEGAAGSSRELQYATTVAGTPVKRWALTVNATAEGGSDAGSDLALKTYKDDGTYLATPLSIARSSGNATFSGTVTAPTFIGNVIGNVSGGTVTGNVELGTAANVANPLISGDATSGFFTPAAKTVAVTTNGNERMRWDGTGHTGIGTTSPKSALDVAGGVAIGTYAGSTAAPTNGLSISGVVAVGTSSATADVALDLGSNTNSMLLPVGTTDQRPAVGVNGMVRYNDTYPAVEAFIGGDWLQLATTGSSLNVNLGTAVNAANPAINGDPSSGFYTPGANTVAVTAGGVEVMQWNRVATAVNYFSVYPAIAGNYPTLAVAGTDNNIGMFMQTKGTGPVTFVTGGGTQASILNTAGSNTYITLTGANTAAPTLGVAGATSGLNISSGGAGAVKVVTTGGTQFQVTNTAASTNYLSATGAADGAAPVLSAVGTNDTDVDIKLTPKGAGQVNIDSELVVPADGVAIGTNVVTAGTALDLGSNTSSLLLPIGTTDERPTVGVNGMMRYNLDNGKFEAYQQGDWQDILTNKGEGSTVFLGTAVGAANPQINGDATTGFYTPAAKTVGVTNFGIETMQWDYTATGVNYFKVAAGATGNAPTLSVGGEANVGMKLSTKGTGAFTFVTGGGTQLGITNTATATNYISFTGGADGAAPVLSAIGANDTDVDIALTPKGAGKVNLTAGNLTVAAGAVAIGTTAVTTGTALDLGSNTSSLLLPIGTTDQRPTGVNGMMRYNSDNEKLEAFQQGAWQDILTNKGSGSTIYIGTALNATNPQLASDATTGLYTSGAKTFSAVAFGVEVMRWNTLASGVNYVSVTPGDAGNGPVIGAAGSDTHISLQLTPKGTGAVNVTTGNLDIQTGNLQLADQTVFAYPLVNGSTYDSTGIAIGVNALVGQTASSKNNIAIGSSSQFHTTTGLANVSVGRLSLNTNTTGSTNVAVGTSAMQSNGAGDNNVAIGGSALGSSTGTISNETAVGFSSLQNATGTTNTALGYQAGKKITTGATNVVIGPSVASTTLTTGSSNILIGTSSSTDTSAAATSNWLSINNAIFGDMSGLNFKIGGSSTLNTGAVLDLSANTNSLLFPIGTTDQRPTGTNGMMRYNSDNGKFEAFQQGAWQDILTNGGTSGLSVSLGTAANATNPSISGDTTSGFYTPAAKTVAVSTFGVETMQWDYTASGVNYVVVKSGATGVSPTITTGGETNGDGIGLNLLGKDASAAGKGGPITITAGAGSGANAGGSASLNGGKGGATGAGGAVTVTGGAGGGTSGNGGTVTIQGGAPTSGVGGGVTLTASVGKGAGNAGGAVSITAGSSSGATAGSGGAVSIAAGGSGTTGNTGGAVTVSGGKGGSSGGTGTGGLVTINGGLAGTGAAGGSVFIYGNDGSGASTNGGSVIIAGGVPGAGGTYGSIAFTDSTTITTQAKITLTASAVNYLNLTGAAAGSGPVLSAAGSDTDINLILTPKGAGTVKVSAVTGTTALDLSANTNSLLFPIGTTDQRPTGVNGMMRYNSDNGKFEGFQQGAWQDVLTNGGTGGLSVTLGTSVTAANPQISGDSKSGFYTPAAKTVAVTANGVEVMQWNTAANGVNYVSVTPGATGVAPTITNGGSDTNGAGLGLILTGRDAGAAGKGGPLTLTGGTGSGANAGGAITITGGTGGASGNGGDTTIYGGSGGATGNGGSLNFYAGNSGISGTNGGNALFLAGSGVTGGLVAIAAGSSSISGTSVGGAVTIDGGTGNAANGGPITITGGSTGKSGGVGGAVTVIGGTGTVSTGGAVTIQGGAGGVTSGAGGAVTIKSGAPTSGAGGAVAITGANGAGGNNTGGAVSITAGTSAGNGTGAAIALTGGVGGPTGNGGAITILGGFGGTTSGDGAAVTIAGGIPLNSGNGGGVAITGQTGVGTNKAGGDVQLTAGGSSGSGTAGVISIAAGIGGATGTGGALTITSGAGGTTSGASGAVTIKSGAPTSGAGGAVAITGANGVGGNNTGGAVSITAGNSIGSGNGAAVSLTAGTSGSSSLLGGAINITGGGSANNAAPAIGGPVVITGGAGSGTNNSGGAAAMAGGNGSGIGSGGTASLAGGKGGATGSGGSVSMGGGAGGATSGAGGAALIIGGDASASGAGGSVTIGGGAGTGTDKAAGGVTISTGNSTGTGTGSITFNTVTPGSTGSSANTAAATAVLNYKGLIIGGSSITTGVALDLGSNTNSLLLPVGTTDQRPTGVNGMLRYNSDSGKFEGYQQGDWQDILTSNASASTVILGTAVNAANPQISGDATSGFYTPAAKTVAVTAFGVEVMQWNYAASGVNYVSVTPGATGVSPTITNGGSDTNGDGLGLIITGRAAGAAGKGGPLTFTGGLGNGGNAGGAIAITSGKGGATGAGGALTLTSGAGGGTSGASGAVTLASGTTTDGNSGTVTIKSGVPGDAAGGAISITAASGTGTDHAGGAIAITAGKGTGTGNAGTLTITAGAGTDLSGGDLTLSAGASDNGTGGIAVLKGGTATTEGDGGPVGITGGDGAGTNQDGGSVNLAGGKPTGTGTAGSVEITGGEGGAGNTAGGAVYLYGGAGGLSGGAGGEIFILGGSAANEGLGGVVTVAGGPATGDDQNAGGLILSGGDSTGTGTSNIQFKVAAAGASGSGSNAAATKMTLSSAGNLFVAGSGIGVGTGTLTSGTSLDLGSNTNSLLLPVGTTDQRPGGVAGMLRYNSDTPGVEAYINGAWATLASAGGATFLGADATHANPQISGDAQTGFYTAGAGKVDVTISGAQVVEWASTGQTTTGTETADGFIPTSSTATGNRFYLPAANTPGISANGVQVMQFNTAASGVNYVSVTPGATGVSPTITNGGSDTNGDGLGLIISGRNAGAAGKGGPLTFTGGKGSGGNAGGAFAFTAGEGGATGAGGAVTITSGTGGATSGAGGALTLAAGAAQTSGAGGAASLAGGAGVGTDKSGGGVTIDGGNASGTGTSTITFKTATAGASGTGTNSSAARMTILGSGNVGVGTTNPTYPFQVSTTATGAYTNLVSFIAPSNTAASSQFLFGVGSNNGGEFRWVPGTPGRVELSTSGDPWAVISYNTDGLVGINTVNPGRYLTVQDDAAGLTLPLQVSNATDDNAGTGPGILFTTGTGGNGRGKGALVYAYGTGSGWNRGDFYFLQGTAGDSSNPTLSDAVMTITNAGRVGIGTTTPDTGTILDLGSDTSSLLLPVGTTDQRPTGTNGMLRYNVDTPALEAFIGGAWATLASAGGATFLGADATHANPQISGDAQSGFYTAGAGKVDVTISGANVVEWASTGQTTTGTETANGFIPTSSTATGNRFYLPAANTPGISANGVQVMRFTTAASGVNYVNVTAAATGAAPIIASKGSDTDVGLTINSQAGGAITMAVPSAAASTGGAMTLTAGEGAATSAGGAIAVTAGKGGATSGAGGALTLTAGAAQTSGAGGAATVAGGAGVGTDKSGGGLTLSGGNSSGTGTSTIVFQTAAAGSTGTGTNTAGTVATITSAGNFNLAATTQNFQINSLNALSTPGTANIILGDTAAVTGNTGSNNIVIGKDAFKLQTDSAASNNVIIGTNAGSASPSPAIANSIAIGTDTLKTASDITKSVAIGYQAGMTTANGNLTAVGYQALKTSGTATGQTAFGDRALTVSTTSGNTAVGYLSLTSASTGAYNTAVGYLSGEFITSGSSNTAVGTNAMLGITGTKTTGSYNTAVGDSALYAAQGAVASNTAVGYKAGYTVTTGSTNVIIGKDVASTTLTTGSSNILIGTSSSTDTPTNNKSNWLSINQAIFGDMSGLNFKIGGSTTLDTGAVLDLSANTNSLLLPVGTTDQRPTGVNGMLRYNSTVPQLEAFINGAWAALSTATGSAVSLGADATHANPQISGDATSGFYSAGAAKVDVTISGANVVEWASTGETITGTSTAGAFIPTSSTATGNRFYLPAANTPSISANGVRVMSFNTAASGVNYIAVTPGATGVAPTIANASGDTNGTGLGLAFTATDASAAGKGGPITFTGGKGSGANAGGAFTLTTGQGGATGAGGTIDITSGKGGTTSGASGAVTIASGTTTSGTSGAVTLKSGAPTGGNGGAVAITGANGNGSNNTGGGIAITGGDSAGSGTGGYAALTAGKGGATGAGGSATLTAGNGGATSGNGGDVTILSGSASGGHGGSVNITANIGGGASANGGSVNITAGLGLAGGTNGTINFVTGTNKTQAVISHTTNAANYLGITGAAAAGSGPVISTAGSDTDIDMRLTPKGAGKVNITTGNLTVASGAIAVGTTSVTTGVALDLGSNTNSLLLPVGTTDQRPTGVNGMLRYNSTVPQVEAFVNGAWAAFSTGSATVTLGTSASAASPQISGDATSGFYTPAAKTVAVTAFGIEVMQWNYAASGVNYVSVTPGATGTGPTITNGGSDTNGAGLNLNITGKAASAAGVGGALTLTAGAGNATGAGGAVTITAGASGATSGTGGAVTITAGAAGASGAGGAATLAGGAATGTDKSGGGVTIDGGNSTGTGTSTITFKVAAAGASASTTRTSAATMTILGSGFVGMGAVTSPGFPLVVGSTSSNGNGAYLSADGVWTDISDRRVKENIKPIVYGLETVMKLKPVSYEMKDSHNKQVGFIAQDVLEVVPEVVGVPKNEKDRYGLAYGNLTAVAVKAIQELKADNDNLRKEIAALKKEARGQRLEASKDSGEDAANDNDLVKLLGLGMLGMFVMLGGFMYHTNREMRKLRKKMKRAA